MERNRGKKNKGNPSTNSSNSNNNTKIVVTTNGIELPTTTTTTKTAPTPPRSGRFSRTASRAGSIATSASVATAGGGPRTPATVMARTTGGSVRGPRSDRGLDRSLNQSLRVLDNRYVEESHPHPTPNPNPRHRHSGKNNTNNGNNNGNNNNNNNSGDDHDSRSTSNNHEPRYYYNNPNDPDNSFNSHGYIFTTDLDATTITTITQGGRNGGGIASENDDDNDNDNDTGSASDGQSYYSKTMMDASDRGDYGYGYGEHDHDHDLELEEDSDWNHNSHSYSYNNQSHSHSHQSSYHYRSDDPRGHLFRLLDEHCPSTAYDETANHHHHHRPNDWEPIREWFGALLPDPQEENGNGNGNGNTNTNTNTNCNDNETRANAVLLLRAAVLEGRGRSGQTVLHVACERSVPLDVLEQILSVPALVNRRSNGNSNNNNNHDNSNSNNHDNNSSNNYHDNPATRATIDGWLPLHYACNYPNDYEVVRTLVEAHPRAKTHADLKGRTPLHFAMREENMNRPEVVALLSSAAGIADDNGILPLHYACLYGATEDFLRILTDAHPQGVASRDRFGRVPLHYSLSNAGRPNAPAAVRLLLGLEPELVNDPGIARMFSGSDAVRRYQYYAASASAAGMGSGGNNGNGNHGNGNNGNNRYRNRYGRSNRQLAHGASPRHGHGHGSAHPGSGDPPAAVASGSAFSRESVEECLKRFLEAKPRPTADFFTALQSLPEALQEKAVLTQEVQELLNQKIGKRFPTALLLSDLYLQLLVMVLYTLAVRDSIRGRFESERIGSGNGNGSGNFSGNFSGNGSYEYSSDDDPHYVAPWSYLIGVYVGLTYFLFREIVQILGLVSLRASWIWIYEPGTWLNVAYICYIGAWTVFMTTGWCEREVFRTGAALSFAVVWLKFLSYLRKILIDFSVFSGGVFHVLRRLLAFLMCLTIILIAFSRMFFTLFYETEYCAATAAAKATATATATVVNNATPSFLSPSFLERDNGGGGNGGSYESFTKDLICEANNEALPWCNAWDSFLAVYTMLLGEVDETLFDNNTTALILFVVFMLLVVILLANVLIAIVTDSYKVIRDKRAAIVFWTNRLDFIAQMDAIASIPWRSRFRGLLGLRETDRGAPMIQHHSRGSGNNDNDNDNDNDESGDHDFGRELWNDIVELFDHNVRVEDGICSLDFVLCTILRAAAVVLVPLWILAGALVVGLLWPPQIREKLFVSTVRNHSSESEKEENLRKTQIEELKREIAVLKEDLMGESAKHRTQIIQMKSAIAERKLETLDTLTAIKKNVVLALELCEMGREG